MPIPENLEAFDQYIDDTVKIYPDESKLNPLKTKGRAHRQLLKDMLRFLSTGGLTLEDNDFTVATTPEDALPGVFKTLDINSGKLNSSERYVKFILANLRKIGDLVELELPDEHKGDIVTAINYVINNAPNPVTGGDQLFFESVAALKAFDISDATEHASRSKFYVVIEESRILPRIYHLDRNNIEENETVDFLNVASSTPADAVDEQGNPVSDPAAKHLYVDWVAWIGLFITNMNGVIQPILVRMDEAEADIIGLQTDVLALQNTVSPGRSDYEAEYIFDSSIAATIAAKRIYKTWEDLHSAAASETKHKKVYLNTSLTVPLDQQTGWVSTTEFISLKRHLFQNKAGTKSPAIELILDGVASMKNVTGFTGIYVDNTNNTVLSNTPAMFIYDLNNIGVKITDSVFATTRNSSSRRYLFNFNTTQARLEISGKSLIKELTLFASSFVTADRYLQVDCYGLSGIEGFFASDKPSGQSVRELAIETDGSLDYETGTFLQDIEDSYSKFTFLEHRKRDSSSINKVLTRPWSSTFLVDFSRHSNIEVYLLGTTSFATVVASRKPRKQFTLRLYAGASDRDLFWNESWKWNLNGNNPPDILFAGKELTIGLEIGPGITESDIKASILQSN